MGPVFSHLGTAAFQAILQLARSAGGRYMASKAVTESTKEIKSWWDAFRGK